MLNANVESQYYPILNPNNEANIQPNIAPNIEPNIEFMNPNIEPNIEPNIQPNIKPDPQKLPPPKKKLHTAAICVAVCHFWAPGFLRIMRYILQVGIDMCQSQVEVVVHLCKFSFQSRCRLGKGRHNVEILCVCLWPGLDTLLKRGIVDNVYS